MSFCTLLSFTALKTDKFILSGLKATRVETEIENVTKIKAESSVEM